VTNIDLVGLKPATAHAIPVAVKETVNCTMVMLRGWTDENKGIKPMKIKEDRKPYKSKDGKRMGIKNSLYRST
jgi:hypothetical protein